MKRRLPIRIARQRGATLIIALIFLVVLSLLGASVASNNTLQERMAGNTRNRDLAFQAAEHALRAADIFIANPDGDGDVTNNATWMAANATAGDVDNDGVIEGVPTVAGLLNSGELHDNDVAYWQSSFTWASGIQPATNLNVVAAQPRYVIERMGASTSYRVTALGTGRDANTTVILQTMYQY